MQRQHPHLVAVLVGTGMRLDEALHLMWTDIDLQHRVILGHSSVAITQQVYAHLHPDAFAEDYSRVSFAIPTQLAR
jgi:integrase